MPELGKYAATVLSAYGVSIALIVALVWVSLHRARRAKAELSEIEERMRNG